jgi:hypothetical protein
MFQPSTSLVPESSPSIHPSLSAHRKPKAIRRRTTTTSFTIPATIYRPERPKASYELVEYCSTIFDTSLDDADRTHTDLPGGGMILPPDQERARKVADCAVLIMLSKGDHLAKMRKHIASLGLTLPRLMRLNRFARSNAMRDGQTRH